MRTGNVKYFMLLANIFGLFFLSAFVSKAQVTQPSGSSSVSTTTCSGNYYDAGGSGGNYANNQNSVQTICPVSYGDVVTINFSSYSTESSFDYIYVYDGPNTSCPQLAALTGSGGPVSYTAKNCSGCLTVNFYSDFSNVAAGFSATISCSTPASYSQIGSTSGGGTGATSGPQCFVYSCGTTYYDPGGSASNYQNNDNSLFTICSTPIGGGTVPSVTFNSFVTEASYDWLAVFDGASNQNNNLLAVYSGTLATPFTIEGTTTNTDGCLTFWFASDGSNNRSGWNATVSCVTPTSNPTYSNTDCWNSTAICNDLTVPGASSGLGNFQELNANDKGCLSAEHQSNWYHFQVTASGTFTMGITPGNGSDDYDYALWGPMTSFNCLLFQSTNTPVRCSYACFGSSCFPGSTACASNSTGISSTNNSPQSDNTESGSGNCWTQTLNVIAGEDYLLLIDNFLSTTTSFTIDVGGTCSIGCVPIVLPLGLLNFLATPKPGGTVDLTWTVDGEKDEKFYVLERGSDGSSYSPLGMVNAKGTSGSNSYSYTDQKPLDNVTNYYRLSSVDRNGTKTQHTIALANLKHVESNFGAFPNPAKGELQISLGNSAGTELALEIYDLYGKLVLSMKFPIEDGMVDRKIDLSDLEAGPYFIKASDGSNTYSKPLILTKD